jgi:hypothetical protein
MICQYAAMTSAVSTGASVVMIPCELRPTSPGAMEHTMSFLTQAGRRCVTPGNAEHVAVERARIDTPKLSVAV